MKKDDLTKLNKGITTELLKDKFISDVGQKAIVQREAIPQDNITEQLGEVLQDIGRNFQETGKAPKGMDYLGSLAIHIYAAPVTRQFANIKQIYPIECPDGLLIKAAEDLSRGVVTYVGKKAPKLRSGF